MPAEADRERDGEKKPLPGQEDQLSPSRALRESLSQSRSQRVGDSGPLANPTVSFPDEPDGGDDESEDGDAEESEARGSASRGSRA
jgi:hypothetical protein